MKYLYIAEKPSTMNEVRKAYNKNRFLGDIDFVALSGHICGLKEPKEYDDWDKPWRELELPLVPGQFKTKVIKKDIADNIKKMIKENGYDAIIVGTDSDQEGNGIYDLLERQLGLGRIKAYRFFEKDLTEKGIMESMHALTDYRQNPRDVGMTEAFRIRSQFDWLIGFNMTIAYTVKSGFLMRVGRVKCPTLKLVYDNCAEIDAFTESRSYQPAIHTAVKEMDAVFVDEQLKDKAFARKEEAQKIVDDCGDEAKIVSITKKVESKPPAQFYKLSDIQVEAGQKYGYSPEATLAVIQSLYETHKVLSYPRTDGRYVSSEKAKEFPILAAAALSIPELSQFAGMITDSAIKAAASSSRFVNDKEVEKSSHDALIPTGKKPDMAAMTEEERNILLMVYRRFLAAFLPPLKEEKTKILLDADGYGFLARGSVVVDPGFTVIFERKPKELALPAVSEGEILDIAQKGLKEVVSRPPKRLTQATLIAAMENIQKYMKKGELRDAMKEAKGIGQPSSRAAIISDLIKTGYMEEKKGGLYITSQGKTYIENLKGCSLLDPELSAEWEVKMKKIRNREAEYSDVYGEAVGYLGQLLDDVKTAQIEKAPSAKGTMDFNCPVCGKPMRDTGKGFGCSGYPECKFFIGTICGKKITASQAKALCSKRKTGLIKGFTSKSSGRPFDAKLFLNSNNEIKFEFPEKTK